MKNSIFISFVKGCLLLLALLGGVNAKSQVYPVQTNVSTTGPYYNYLSYYADENRHLQAIVTLTDFNSPAVTARLRITIEGPGYQITTNPNLVVGNAFVLEPGVPNFISGIELAPYFQSSNVLVSPSGVDINNLPEGFTTICVDVIRDGTAGEIISTHNCTSFYLQRLQPPQGVFPMCGSSVSTDELFYTFQWSPPVGYVPAVGAELLYTFSLYEWNDQSNYNIFQTGQGLVYMAQTTSPVVQLSSFDLSLQQGKQYVWRVQAEISSSGVLVHMIDNNGLSEPCTFTFGSSQTLQEALTNGLHINLNATGVGEWKGKAYWTVIDNTPTEGLSTYSSFLISHRKKPTGNEDFEMRWRQDTVEAYDHFMYQLESATTYEVKVAGIVDDYISEPSQTVEFTTLPPREYTCGEADQPYLSPQYTPLKNALVGMRFQIGQFTLQVTEITPLGPPGRYKGKGLIPVAFLGGAKAKVRFDDILVDDQYVVREGQVDVITDGLDNWLTEQYANLIDPVYVNGTVDSAYVHNGVAWVVVNGSALEFHFNPPDYPVVINDDSGVQYTIWPNGEIKANTYLVVSSDYLSVEAHQVATFVQNDNETFGFDAKEHMQWHNNYEVIQLSDSSYYFVPNKSIGQGEADVVDFELPDGVSNSTFKLDDTTPLSGVSGNTLTLPDNLSAGKHAIYLYNGSNRIGKLNLYVYPPKEKEVVIVPLTAAPISQTDIKTAIDATIGEANIEVTVTVAPRWNDSVYTPTKTIALPTDVGLLNKYSEDMRSLRDHYVAANDSAPKKAYYIFVVPGFDDGTTDGYMVRGKAFGFVKAGEGGMTYAHELSHGLGALDHTWNNNGPPQGTTNNLMDYSNNATQLIKAQWKELRDRDVIPSLLDDVEDGMQAVVRNIEALDPFRNSDGTLTFLSVGGKSITLKGELTMVRFATTEDKWKVDQNYFPIGTLTAFELDGVFYQAKSNQNSLQFKGYKDTIADEFYKDSISWMRNDSITTLAGIPCLVNTNVVFKVFPLSNYQPNITEQYNTGAGLEQNSTYYSSYFEWENLAVEVYAHFSSDITSEQLTFIHDLGGENICGESAIYAFRAAYLLNENPNLVLCIDELKNETYTDLHPDEPVDVSNITVSDGLNSIDYTSFYVPVVIDEPITPPFEKFDFDYKASYNKEFIQYFHDLLEKWIPIMNDNTTSVGTGMLYSDFSDLVDFFNLLEDNQRKCLLKILPVNLRLAVLSKHSEWVMSAYYTKERFICDLIESTAPGDIPIMLNYLSGANYEMFWSLYGDLYNDEARDRYVSIVTMFKFQVDDYDHSLDQNEVNSLGGEGVNYTRYLHAFKQFDTYDQPLTRYMSGNTTSNGQLRFQFKIYNYADDYTRSGDYWEGDPFEFISVEFEDNYQILNIVTGQNIKAGDRVIVPAFWFYRVLERQSSIETWAGVRMIINAGAALISLATLEPGPLLVADLVFNIIDFAVAANEDRILSSGTNQEKEFLNQYNTFALAYGGAYLFQGIVNSAPLIQKQIIGAKTTFLFHVKNIPHTYQKIKNAPADVLKLIDDLKALLVAVKDVPPSLFTGKNVFKALLMDAILELKINSSITNLSDANVLIRQNGKVIIQKTISEEYQIARVPSNPTSTIRLEDITWYSSATDDPINSNLFTFDNCSYTQGITHYDGGQLEVVISKSGKPVVKIVNPGVVNEVGGGFAKLTSKSSLGSSAFNQLDNALTSAPSIKFNYGSKTLQNPKQFLNETGSDMYDLVLSNGGYAKFDKATGRMLYSDGTNQYFIRYTTGNNVTDIQQLITTRVTRLRNYLGLNGSQIIQLEFGLGTATTSSNKVITFIGKTDETQKLKDLFGDFKHIEVGETAGAVNLLNMPDTYWNPSTWFADYNQDWMVRAINRGDEIYIASPINANSLYNKKPDNSFYGSYFANELNELVVAGVKPKNISQAEWNNLIPEIQTAAAAKY